MATEQATIRQDSVGGSHDEVLEVRALLVALRVLLDRYHVGPCDAGDVTSGFSREDQLAFRRLLHDLQERLRRSSPAPALAPADPAPLGDDRVLRIAAATVPVGQAAPTKARIQRPLALTWSAATQARAMSEPPTPGQLLALRQHGIVEAPATKADASDILRQLRLRGQR